MATAGERGEKLVVDSDIDGSLVRHFHDLYRGGHPATKGETIIVPGCAILIAGFPCQSKSSLNRSRGEHNTCVQEGTGKTGLAFHDIIMHIDSCQFRS